MLLKNTWACILCLYLIFLLQTHFYFILQKYQSMMDCGKKKKESFTIKFKKHCIGLLKQGEVFTAYN